MRLLAVIEHLTQRVWPAGKAFALLGGVFGGAFLLLVFWLAVDQRLVLEASQRLHDQTVPSTLEHFRLARNVEQLRLEGERIFAGKTFETRQQALFVVSLLTNHPALLADAHTARLARETETFLVCAAREGITEARYAEWTTLSHRLSFLADELSVKGVNLATADLLQMSETMRQGRVKLSVVLALVAGFVVVCLLLIRRHLIHPLQTMSQALTALHENKALAPFPQGAMSEIREVEGAIGQLQQVMQENERVRQELERLATTDGLTGLYNRRHFITLAETEIQRAQRYERPICIGMADLDFFKRINDSHGHAAGDVVLQSMSELFRMTLRKSDWACRWGGEEFAFVFPETTLGEAQALAERLRQCAADSRVELADSTCLCFTLSLGVTDASNCSLDEAFRRADDALYEAKKQGRNRVALASQALAQPHLPLA